MVITDIVINTLLGRVTRHPAGMHCPARDIVLTLVAIVSEMTYTVSSGTLNSSIPYHWSLGGATIFVKLGSKIAKSPQNRWKSLCTPLRIDS